MVVGLSTLRKLEEIVCRHVLQITLNFVMFFVYFAKPCEQGELDFIIYMLWLEKKLKSRFLFCFVLFALSEYLIHSVF